MSQNYIGRSSRSLNKSAYSTSTSASSGRLVRQKQTSSRVPPGIILCVVISVGLILIGAVMTVIANWPGYSGAGFNVLEILGPGIVAAGILSVICVAIFIVLRNNNQREIWQKKMVDAERTKVWASRTTLDSGVRFAPPNSNYGDSNVFDERSFSGSIPQVNNVSYQQEDSRSYGQHSVYKIQTIPDTAVPSVHQTNRRPDMYSKTQTSHTNGRIPNGNTRINHVPSRTYNNQPNQHPCVRTGLNNSIVSYASTNREEPPLARSSSSKLPEIHYPPKNTTPPKACSSPTPVPQYNSVPAQIMASQQQVRSPRTPQYNRTVNLQKVNGSPLIGMPDLGSKVASF